MVRHLLGPLLSRQWVCIIAYDACNVGRHSEKSKKKNQTRSDSPTQRRRMAKHDSYYTQWRYADRQEHDIIMSSASRTPLRRCPEKVPSAARHERRATHVVARLLLLIFLLLVLPIRTARPLFFAAAVRRLSRHSLPVLDRFADDNTIAPGVRDWVKVYRHSKHKRHATLASQQSKHYRNAPVGPRRIMRLLWNVGCHNTVTVI